MFGFLFGSLDNSYWGL